MFNSPRSHRLILTLVAAGIAGSAVPAFAKQPAADQSKTRMTIEQKDGQTVYCVTDRASTGTILNNKVCHTRSEWADKGLVIPEQQQRAGDSAKSQPAG